MPRNEGTFSGPRWNRITDSGLDQFRHTKQLVKDALLADGYPPFSVPTSERDELRNLQALKLSDSAYFWNSRSAQGRLATLEARYGGGV